VLDKLQVNIKDGRQFYSTDTYAANDKELISAFNSLTMPLLLNQASHKSYQVYESKH